jgi:hypothetical protein
MDIPGKIHSGHDEKHKVDRAAEGWRRTMSWDPVANLIMVKEKEGSSWRVVISNLESA